MKTFIKNLTSMHSESIRITFDGQSHQIDVNTLINTLIHHSNLINHINDVVGDGSKKIDVKVTAPERGSFVTILSFASALEAIKDFFSGVDTQYLANLATILGVIWVIYKDRKGHPVPKDEVEKVDKEVKQEYNINIEELNIVELYNQPLTREPISKAIESASSDVAIEGIHISNNHEHSIEIAQEEFSELVYDDFDKEEEYQEHYRKIIDPNAELHIVTLSQDKKVYWGFVYKGQRIRAKIEDDYIYKYMSTKQRVAAGDILVVELETIQQFDEKYEVFMNNKYKVLKMESHTPREHPQQIELDM